MNIDPAEIRILIRVATRCTGSPLHDEDLIQETALKAVLAFKREGSVRHPRAFLMKIVRDAVRDHWRRKRVATELADIEAPRIASLPEFEAELDRSRQKEHLRLALRQLDCGKRRTLELFYVEDCSIAEIAAMQGKTSSAVKMELLRVRRSLAAIVSSLANKKSR